MKQITECRNMPITRSKDKRNKKGFTLIELLLASVLAGVMVLAFLTATTSYFQTDSQQRQTISVQQGLRRAIDYMASDTREAAYIYPNPATAYALIAGSATPFPSVAGQTPTPVLGLIQPEIGPNNIPTGQFVLVVYATAIKPPNSDRYTAATNIQGQILYRWVSRADNFDPLNQVQLVGSTNYFPGSLQGNFLLYGGLSGDTYPTPIIGNIATAGITATPSGSYASPLSTTQFSSTGLNIVANSVLVGSTKADGLKGGPQQQTLISGRNVGIPITPLPLTSEGGGQRDSCLTSKTTAVCPTPPPPPPPPGPPAAPSPPPPPGPPPGPPPVVVPPPPPPPKGYF
jgi:prepilin-type N-terminal cleavage/methylation domain-containing protein